MDNNKYYYNLKYNLFILLLVIFYVLQFIYHCDVNLCDSNDNINDFVLESISVDNTLENKNNEEKIAVTSTTIKPKFFKSLKNLIKRKIYWDISVKDTKKYSSFTEFNNSSWQPTNSIWKEIKIEAKSEWDLLKQGKLK